MKPIFIILVLAFSAAANAGSTFLGNFQAAGGINEIEFNQQVKSQIVAEGITLNDKEAAADLVVSGKVFTIDQKMTVVAKITGKNNLVLGETETSKPGETAAQLASRIAKKIATTLKAKLPK